MQLFTYLYEGCTQCARLIGTTGINLNFAATLYSQTIKKHKFDSLLDVFIDNETFNFVQQSTDWILLQSKSKYKELHQQGVIFDFEKAELLAPVPVPGKVICIAGNFPAPNKMEKPEYPIVFLKPASGIAAHKQAVILPEIVASAAYEVELAVIIGKPGRNLTRQNALSCVAGFTLANDIGDRLLEKRTSQWTSGKMFDTFTPMGPVLITPDELGDLVSLSMTTRVNGEVVQKGNTSEMFFDVATLTSIVSELTTLQPGDVILTGSPKLMDGQPAPVASLKPGDSVEVCIDGLGTLKNPVIAESRVF
jgi:acylpyruvate hydrolase